MAYVLFPKGHDDRFWAYGYETILQHAFLSAPNTDAIRRGHASARTVDDDAGASAPADQDVSSCERGRVSADALIERIAQATAPSEPQRGTIDALRAALSRAGEQIDSSCPAQPPANATERLSAIASRIWAMHDAVLTLRQPVEQFFAALSDEQRWRLQRAGPDLDPGDTTGRAATAAPTAAASGAASRPRSTGDAEAGELCGRSAADMIEPLRAIERALRPTDQQRAGLEQLQMLVAGMSQLIASTCPSYPLLGPMDRIAAAADRLDAMLFAVMTLSPALPSFYESLGDGQKAALDRAVRQFRRPGPTGDGS